MDYVAELRKEYTDRAFHTFMSNSMRAAKRIGMLIDEGTRDDAVRFNAAKLVMERVFKAVDTAAADLVDWDPLETQQGILNECDKEHEK